MAQFNGNINKMHVSASGNGEVEYLLPIGDELVNMNALLGTNISVAYNDQINCVNCSRKTNKSFNQGHCFVCLKKLARCDTCIIKPELCHFHAGTCREPEWGERNCLQDHFVYLSNTGQVKVGITRHVNEGISSRWIDQGATQALAIFRVQQRLHSGLVEQAVKEHVGDKTNWRLMLKGVSKKLDLIKIRDEIYDKTAEAIASIQQIHGLQAIQKLDVPPVSIVYPVQRYPAKIASINLDKEKYFEGVLEGIKGQYLMLSDDRVINIRKYSGYYIELSTIG